MAITIDANDADLTATRAGVIDVAAYIAEKLGETTHMKLEKLVYYAQAWACVWSGKPLFAERIQAWANGPVSPQLYFHLRGMFNVRRDDVPGDPERLSADEKGMVDKVIDFYGDKNPQWLSDLTHMERPWSDARRGLADGERGEREITPAAMEEYYGSL